MGGWWKVGVKWRRRLKSPPSAVLRVSTVVQGARQILPLAPQAPSEGREARAHDRLSIRHTGEVTRECSWEPIRHGWTPRSHHPPRQNVRKLLSRLSTKGRNHACTFPSSGNRAHPRAVRGALPCRWSRPATSYEILLSEPLMSYPDKQGPSPSLRFFGSTTPAWRTSS